jgi:hypothetical protein
MMHLTNVLLPAPFSPSKAWNVPGLRVIETLSNAVMLPNRLVMLITSNFGGLVVSMVTLEVVTVMGVPQLGRSNQYCILDQF